MSRIAESELILNADGSVYHLSLLPEDIATTILTVGDPDRVERVSKHFDSIEVSKHKREFVTHTGTLNGKRLTVISTGIGTDNIDIVVNELDALVNIDLEKREPRASSVSLEIIRIGTSGALHADIALDSIVVSKYGLGLDGLMTFYNSPEVYWPQGLLEFCGSLGPPAQQIYIAPASLQLDARCPSSWQRGITVTCPGFYAPQGRQLRARPAFPGLLDKLRAYDEELRITNFEMETAGIYGLGGMLGHDCISLNAIVANRATGEFSKTPHNTVDRLIMQTLDLLTA